MDPIELSLTVNGHTFQFWGVLSAGVTTLFRAWLAAAVSAHEGSAMKIDTILEGVTGIMGQLEDIKAAQAETKAALAEQATALAEISTDLDALIALAQTPGADLTEVAADAVAIRDSVRALADAATAAAAKYPVVPPPPPPPA